MYRYRREKLHVNHFWDIKGKEKDDVILSVNDTRILREKELREKELREKELRVLPTFNVYF